MSNSLLALPMGNPALSRVVEEGLATSSAAWVNFRLGYEGDMVSDLRLHQKPAGSGKILTLEKMMQAGVAVLSLRNRLDVYGVAGQARFCGYWNVHNDQEFSRLHLLTRYGYSWALGMKAIFLEWGKATLSAGGRYQSAHISLSSITKNGVPYDVDQSRLKQREWQVDLGLAYKIKIFVPYVEGFYSKPRFFIGTLHDIVLSDDGGHSLSLKKMNRFGLGLGCGITSGTACLLNFEARLFNEEAATVSVDFRF